MLTLGRFTLLEQKLVNISLDWTYITQRATTLCWNIWRFEEDQNQREENRRITQLKVSELVLFGSRCAARNCVSCFDAAPARRGLNFTVLSVDSAEDHFSQ